MTLSAHRALKRGRPWLLFAALVASIGLPRDSLRAQAFRVGVDVGRSAVTSGSAYDGFRITESFGGQGAVVLQDGRREVGLRLDVTRVEFVGNFDPAFTFGELPRDSRQVDVSAILQYAWPVMFAGVRAGYSRHSWRFFDNDSDDTVHGTLLGASAGTRIPLPGPLHLEAAIDAVGHSYGLRQTESYYTPASGYERGESGGARLVGRVGLSVVF